MNELLIATAGIGVIGFFCTRLVNSVDAMKNEMTEMRILMAENFATKEEVEKRLEEFEESIGKDMEVCALRHHGSHLKEVI